MVETKKAVQRIDPQEIFVSTLGLPSGEIALSLYHQAKREMALFEIKHASEFVQKQA
ncbi:MAG: hypothetical protein IJS50_03020 [Desulfovibrio sp.]|nr:hypothetical protein [Desulfovibrio sp.]